METNPAYGRTERLDSELMNGNQSEEYVYISNEERRKYVHSSPPSHENNSTEVKDSIEKPTKKSQGNSQTRKCPLIAITVTLVITMLIAITAFAIGIVALYALGEETIDRERQLTVHMEWEQRYNELLNVDSSLQSEVNTLATQINNPMIVRLSQNCTVDTQTCNIEPMSSPLYWRGCLTSPHLINIPDHFTMGMRCLYDRGIHFMLESAQLIKRDGTVFCSCSVINPDPFGQELRLLPTDLNGTCTLEITRCPF